MLLWAVIWGAGLLACKPDVAEGPNILIVISDDLGVESSACYDTGTVKAPQPTIAGLCERGVVFEQVWAYPVCSPTRAAIFTGRHAWRTGVGCAVRGDQGPLPESEISLARRLGDAGYHTANIGKWHLGGELDHPNRLGWDHYTGLFESRVLDYYSWTRVTDGRMEQVHDYATSVHADDALDWLGERGAAPWLLWMAFTAPHVPLHLPPAELITDAGLSGTADDIDADPVPYFHAMIEAMDTELARLLDSVDDDTWIIYLGDNGTEAGLDQGYYADDQHKFSLYQGGIHVPMVIVGPGVTPGRVAVPVHVVDLFATVLELAGVEAPDVVLDSASLAPFLTAPDTAALRAHQVSVQFGEDVLDREAGGAVRDDRHKLIALFDGSVRMFDLQDDPLETRDLLEAPLDSELVPVHEALSAELAAVMAEIP